MKKLLLILLIVGCEETTAPTPTHGCLDGQATNYDATASIDNNTCTYIDSCGVVDIDKTNDCIQDCNGDWDGNAQLTDCILGNWKRTFTDYDHGEILLTFLIQDNGTWTGAAQSLDDPDGFLENDGIYNINDNEMTITSSGCLFDMDSHNGTYSISIDTNELVIILIEDECTHFAEWFVGTYTKN